MTFIFFVPRGQTFLTHRRGEREKNISYIEGWGQTFFGSGAYDDVDEEMLVSEANFLVSKTNIFLSKES